MEVSKQDILSLINNLDEQDLKKIYNDYKNLFIKKEKVSSKDEDYVELTSKNKVIDKSSDKYKIALKFINKILFNIGKPEINDLRDFKNIDREDIIKDVNKETLEAYEGKLFEYFDKVKCGWYRKKTINNYILTFLRNMCNIIGTQFIYEKRDITEKVNGKNYRKTHVFYSIK